MNLDLVDRPDVWMRTSREAKVESPKWMPVASAAAAAVFLAAGWTVWRTISPPCTDMAPQIEQIRQEIGSGQFPIAGHLAGVALGQHNPAACSDTLHEIANLR